MRSVLRRRQRPFCNVYDAASVAGSYRGGEKLESLRLDWRAEAEDRILTNQARLFVSAGWVGRAGPFEDHLRGGCVCGNVARTDEELEGLKIAIHGSGTLEYRHHQ